jgi:hypothetical protein
MTDEGRARLSAAMKQRWANKETREQLMNAQKKAPRVYAPLSDEAKAKISASRAAAWRTGDKEVVCEHMSQAVKNAWSDPEKRAARIEKCRATRAAKKEKANG